MSWLRSIAAVFTGVVNIGKYLINRRRQAWSWYKNWRKGYREDKVDKVIASRDSKRMGKLLHDILKKRHKRHKTS